MNKKAFPFLIPAFLAFFLVFFSANSQAADLFVTASPTAEAVCTIDNPCGLQAALDQAKVTEGITTIHVNAGTYSLSTGLSYSPGGSDAPGNLVIIGSGTGGVPVITKGETFEGGSLLTIDTTAMSDGNDGGILISVQGLIFKNGASSGNGGGLNLKTTHASADVINCVFDNNTAANGGGIYASTTDGTLSFTNNTIISNSAISGVGVAAPSGGGLNIILTADSARAEIYNNIIYGNSTNPAGNADELYIDYQNNSSNESIINGSNNIFSGSTFGKMNLNCIGSTCISQSFWSIDPALLTDPQLAEDYHLLSGSPAINEGDNAIIDSKSILSDFEGDDRIYNVAADIGADEYIQNHTVTVSISGTVSVEQAVTITSSPGGVNCTWNGTEAAGACTSGGVIYGAQVVLTAALPAGTTIVWGAGCDSTTATTCTINSLTSDRTLSPVTTAETHTVTVSLTGTVSAGQTVMIAGNTGQSCTWNGTEAGGTCTFGSITYGSPVFLFIGTLPDGTTIEWGAGCNSTTATTCTINSLTADKTVSPVTTAETHTVTVSPTGTVSAGQTVTITGNTGSLNCTWNGTAAGGACTSGSIIYGTQVVLTAALPAGTTIAWGGGCDSTTATTCTINGLTANKTISPVTTAETHTVTVGPTGTVSAGQTVTITSNTGSLNCTWNGTAAGGACTSGSIIYGTQVALTAALPAGTTIAWGGGCDSTTATTCTINGLTANKTISPVTTAETHTVTVSPTGTVSAGQTVTITGNTGSLNCTWNGTAAGGACTSGSIIYGTQVVLTAALPAGTTIAWGGGCDSTTATTCTINGLTANKTISPVATAETHRVTANADGNGSGTVASDAGGISFTYQTASTMTSSLLVYGTTVRLTATANASTVAEWPDCVSSGGTPGGTASAATCEVAVEEEKTVTARFSSIPVALPRTGQTKCYNESGVELPSCAGTGQDGDFKAGMGWPTPRFTVNVAEVADELTGLIWAKDAGTPAAGACATGPKTWQDALSYVTCLNANSYLGRNDWRLPNMNELRSLVHAGEPDVGAWLRKSENGFTNVQSSDDYVYYWSSTSVGNSGDQAWVVPMRGGQVFTQGKNGSGYVWPVRGTYSGPAPFWKTGQTGSNAAGDDGTSKTGVPWPSPRFSVNTDGTVDDGLTGLIWMSEGDTPGKGVQHCAGYSTKTWQEALDYVACLNTITYLGHSNWRLPNVNELRSLVNAGAADVAAWLDTQGFTKMEPSFYWTSTISAADTAKVWNVDMAGGVSIFVEKSNYLYVLAVRSGADLSVMMTGTDPVLAGDNVNITYTITVTNNGPGKATGVILTDTLPLGATVGSASPGSCDATNGTVSCNLGNMDAGASVVVTIGVTAPNMPGSINNVAGVTGNEYDPNGSNNTATLTTALTRPDISIAPAPGHDFGSINKGSASGAKEFTIANTGAADLIVTSIVLTGGDAGMFSVKTGGSTPCPNLTPTIAAGASCTVAVGFEPSTEGPKSTTFRTVSNASNTPALDVALSGTGTAQPVFNDCPEGSFAENFINTLYYSGITGGCGSNSFCPDSPVTRAQMAVFILAALKQSPSSCTGAVFNDVNSSLGGFCGFIERFATLGITGGCGGGNFCPNDPVTRAQMAVFMTTALDQSPAASCSGVFNDANALAVGDTFCRYIEKFATLGITAGCGGGNYCPNSPVTRAQMAVFLTVGFLQ